MKSITALEARKRLGGLLDEVAKKGSHILISRLNQPLAVLIPYDDYQQSIDRETRKKRLLLVAHKMDLSRKRLHEKVKGKDTTQIIRDLRSTR